MAVSRWTLCWVMVVAVAMISLPAESWAQQDPLDKVRAANSHYDNGEFRRALRLYREAHDEIGDERLLYRIGLSYENIGNYQRAREFLEQYLREDPESPVRGRVEATIGQLTNLERQIQSTLLLETEPPGAEVYLERYMGQSEGQTPVEIPVGAGENSVTLVFPQGQRLEVVVDVGAGEREERFFQVGTGERPTTAPDEIVDRTDDPVDEPVDEPVEDPDRDPDEERPAVAQDDAIPVPGAEPRRRPIQLDDVNIGPPLLAHAGGVALIFLGNASIYWGAYHMYRYRTGGGFLLMGATAVGAGTFLLARNWRNSLRPAPARATAGVEARVGPLGLTLTW